MDIEVIYLFSKLIVFLVSLVLIGEPLRVVLAKYVKLFKQFGLLQILVIDAYLAGLIIYAIAMIPLHLFNITTMWSVLILFGSLTFLMHWRSLESLNPKGMAKRCRSLSKGKLLKNVVVLALFLSTLWIEVIPLSNYVYGNVQDSALFGLFTSLIQKNQQVPVTIQPYGTEGIIYPQGFFTMEAFACDLLGLSTAEVTLRITPLFMALAVLAAYCLGRMLSPESPLDIGLAFTFWCVSRWPTLLLWGSNAFVGGFPLYLVAIGLIMQLKDLKKENMAQIVVISLLYGYLAAIHLVFYEILFVMFGLITIFTALQKREFLLQKIGIFLVFCAASIVPIGVSIYRFIAWHSYLGHNIGLPSDTVLIGEQWTGGVPLTTVIGRITDWTVFSDWINPYPLIRNMIIALFVIGIISFLLLRKSNSVAPLKRAVVAALSSGAAAGLIIILSTNETVNMFPVLSSIAILAIQVAETTIVMLTALFITLGVCSIVFYHGLQKLYMHIRNYRNNRLHKKAIYVPFWDESPRKRKAAIFKATMFSILSLTMIYTPFVYYLSTQDLQYMNGQYNLFCVTTQDDNQLMLWMKDKLPSDSKILINPSDAGGFIPLVSNYSVIYQPGASRYSASYGDLVNMLIDGTLNTTTYELIRNFNVTYIFVGSTALFNHQTWDPMLFLGNPNFELVKNIGKAYLFKVNLTHLNLSLIFSDNFESGDLNTNGWIISESSNQGQASAQLISEQGCENNSSLEITARSSSGSFWYSMYRKIYVPSSDNVSLSFCSKIGSGFSGADDFMIIVSDQNWTNHLIFSATPNRVDRSVIVLPMPDGSFQFNISDLWQRIHNSTLPTSLYLQIQNYDSDGVQNDAYIDYITVTMGKPEGNISYWDHFDFDTVTYPGWQISHYGAGSGNITAMKNPDNGQGLLEMTAKCDNSIYWSSIYKAITLPQNWNSATLFFNVNASEGFGNGDALGIVISDINWKHQLFLTTNDSGIASPYTISSGKYQEFDLGTAWSIAFNSTLPVSFYLQIQNVDRDGFENIAQIYLIGIKVEIQGNAG